MRFNDTLWFLLSLHTLHLAPWLSLYISLQLEPHALLDVSLAFGAPILVQLYCPGISLSDLYRQRLCKALLCGQSDVRG